MKFRKTFESVDPNRERDQINAALFLSHFMNMKEADDSKYVLPECDFTKEDLIEYISFDKPPLRFLIPALTPAKDKE